MNDEISALKVLVTGGASGIGLATVRALSARGARVAVIDLVEGPPGDHVALRADLTDDTAVRASVEGAADLLDGLDVVINNAGIGAQGTVADNLDEEWWRVLDVNVLGIVRVSRAALPALRRSSRASIVNVCSIAATAGLPRRALYSASKGAVLSLTRAMAADHVGEGIRVNCVSPGTVDTPWVDRLVAAAESPDDQRDALVARQPHNRLVTADEVAYAVMFLASPASGSTTGIELAVDGGMSGLRV